MIQIRQLFKFGVLLVCCGLLASCGNEDELTNGNGTPLPDGKYPLMLTATLDGELMTRAIGKDAWNVNDQIGARIENGAIGRYEITNAASGAMNAVTPAYWQNTAPATVTAWYPADAQTDVDISNQSGGFANFDYLKAEVHHSTYNQTTIALPFEHVMAKVKVTLTTVDADLTDAKVSILGYPMLDYDKGIVTGKGENAYITAQPDGTNIYEALLVPQQMNSDVQFIKVSLKDYEDYYYALEASTNLQGGDEYSYTITVNKGQLPVIDLTLQSGDVYTVTQSCILYGNSKPLDMKIVIEPDKKVVLRDVMLNLDVVNGDAITCKGNTIIILEGENELYGRVNGPGVDSSTGILVESGTLTINGSNDDLLKTWGKGSAYRSGIRAANGANIIINGGNITAEGGTYTAAIGSADNGVCGDITINGGIITTTGNDSSIGGGSGGSCGKITITGGTLNISTDIGRGICGDITIFGGTINAGRITSNNGDGDIIISDGNITTGGILSNNLGDIIISGGDITTQGATYAAGIGSSGSITGRGGNCGNINISGGTIMATGGNYGAGIGSGDRGSCGSIDISGGNITAQGGFYGAGIGSGDRGSCGSIDISGTGTIVVAQAGGGAASIGAGGDGTCGSITIDPLSNVIEN